MSYAGYVFLPAGINMPMEHMIDKLTDFFLHHDPAQRDVKVYRYTDSFSLSLDGWRIYFTPRSKEFLDQKVQDIIGERSFGQVERMKLAACDKIIEISSEDDFNMDYFNDYLLAAEKLGDMEGSILYDVPSQEITWR